MIDDKIDAETLRGLWVCAYILGQMVACFIVGVASVAILMKRCLRHEKDD